MPVNNAKRWSLMSGIILLVSLIMIFLGATLKDLKIYWMIYVGSILGVTFLILLFIFIRQAVKLERLFKGEQLLAHWLFEPADREKKIQKKLEERKGRHLLMLIVIGVLFLIITSLFVIFGFDNFTDSLGFIAFMAFIFLVILVFALVTPYISYKRNKKAIPQIYIGPHSVWMMGEYTQWKAPMTKITGVVFNKNNAGYIIEIHLYIFQKYGPQPHLVSIPIPEGLEDEGLKIAEKLSVINKVKFSNLA